MKSAWLIAAICILGCSKDDKVQPANVLELLSNGSVEAGSIMPDNWLHPGPIGTYENSWTTEESFSPSHSLKIANASTDPINFTFWMQTFEWAMPEGKELLLTVKIKGELTGSGVAIAIRGDDTVPPSGAAEAFSSTEGVTTINGMFDWTTFQVKLTTPSAPINSVTIYLLYLPGTSGKVYFDDAKLTLTY